MSRFIISESTETRKVGNLELTIYIIFSNVFFIFEFMEIPREKHKFEISKKFSYLIKLTRNATSIHQNTQLEA